MKQIIIDYEEYLDLINAKQQYDKDLESIKKFNNYDILLDFIKEYENKLKYHDFQVREYGREEWVEITLPFEKIYSECKTRINEKIIGVKDER